MMHGPINIRYYLKYSFPVECLNVASLSNMRLEVSQARTDMKQEFIKGTECKKYFISTSHPVLL